MRKFASILLGYVVVLTCNAQDQKKAEGEKLDTIILVSNKNVIAKVQGVTSTRITFYRQGSTKLEEMDRKQVHKIKYTTGRVEMFNKLAFEMVDEGDWKTVILTEKPEEVEGLYDLGKIDAQSSKGSRNAKSAERSARIRLQKKAANMGGMYVLITKSEAKGGYREVPTHFFEGIVYGLEPPKETPK